MTRPAAQLRLALTPEERQAATDEQVARALARQLRAQVDGLLDRRLEQRQAAPVADGGPVSVTVDRMPRPPAWRFSVVRDADGLVAEIIGSPILQGDLI